MLPFPSPPLGHPIYGGFVPQQQSSDSPGSMHPEQMSSSSTNDFNEEYDLEEEEVDFEEEESEGQYLSEAAGKDWSV